MKKILLLLIITLMTASCTQAVNPDIHAANSHIKGSATPRQVGSAPPRVMQYRLDNGLRVFISEDHKSPVATFQIWYGVGAIDETRGKTGLSHFLEHMMFKGTPKYASKVFSNLIQKNGGTDNAATSRDYTFYYQNLASDRLNLSMEMEADRMANLLLIPEDVDSEKKVVMEERRMRIEDDPKHLLFEEVAAKAFTAHPYHNPVIGWMEDISSFSRDDLMRHYKTYYTPNNAIAIVAGDVNPEEVMKLIKKYFGDIPAVPIKAPPIPVEPPQTEQRRVTVKKQAKLPLVLIAYHVPSVPHKDAYALEVLSQIFSGKSGRLYQDIVKKENLALNVFANYNALHKAPYLFFWGGIPKDTQTIEKLEAAMLKEIENAAAAPPAEREVQKAKNQIEAAFVMGQDSIFFQGEVLGMFEMLGSWRLKDEYLKGVASVTPADVQAVAKKYFQPQNSTIGMLIPQE
ncbi:MAG: insulinase family protein [Nitrospirae bacterium]|nr:insulinase family protein [Nitrospirota bacterium]